VTLGAEAARDGLVLSSEASWNQNEADWRFFLTHGTVFGIRDGDRLIATAALLPYSGGNAWISMVLVTAAWRRRGLATKLVDACLARAAEHGLTAWLDATPAGAAVYGPLGFKPVLELRRLRLAGTGMSSAPVSNGDIDQLISRDRRAMGFERGALLREFANRPGSRVVSQDGAMALVRDGRTARQIGPLYADDIAAAEALVEEIAASETDPLLMDVVQGHSDRLATLTASGWSIERPFQRMRFGRGSATGEQLPCAVAGPEFG
jgi:GNAT superfamily N-acetyltransferase